MDDIKRCAYANDPGDEYCSQCDGIHFKDDNGNDLPPDRCGGYQPAEDEEPAAPVQAEEPSETAGDQPEATAPMLDGVQGVTTTIRAESGLSREINGTWYKFTYSEERILPEGADLEAEKEALWDAVNAQVDAQLAAVTG